MKKLLTVFALALILCLGVSALVSANAVEETYKATYTGPWTLSTDGTCISAKRADIENIANWVISDPDWKPLPDSAGAPTARAATYVVKEVLIGAVIHGEPTLITVTGEKGVSAPYTIMIAENDHNAKGDKEYAVVNGVCHSRRACTEPGCTFPGVWSLIPDHDPAKAETKIDEDGKKVVYCTECGKEYDKFNDGHNHAAKAYREWLEMPDCKNDAEGTYYWACGECGVALKKTATGFEVADEFGPSIWFTDNVELYVKDHPEWKWDYDHGYLDHDGHQWGDYATLTAADCLHYGTKTRTCYVCDKQVTVKDENAKPKGIFYAPVTVACDYDKAITLKCKYCNGTNTATVDDTGKDWGRDHKVTVTIGKEIKTLADLDTYPTSQNPTVSAIKLQHDYNFTASPYVVDPTCVQVGTRSWYCRKGLVDWNPLTHKPTAQKGLHNIVANPVNGEGAHVEYTPELGHDWSGEWKCVVEPDVNVRGIWVKTCARLTCDTTKQVIDWNEPCTEDTHDFVLNEDESVAATCTEAGYNFYECTKCGDFYTEEVEALGHKATWNAQVPATCTKAGVKIGKCDRCGAYLEEELPVIDHAWGEWTVKTPATPTTKGIEERKCANCDATEEREVEYKPAETSVYTVSNFVYDKDAQEVTGKVTLDPTTAAQKVVKARVSFYLADKSWFAVVTDVKADGTFSVGTNVNAVYVKVNIMGENATHHIPDEKDVYGTGEAKIVGE